LFPENSDPPEAVTPRPGPPKRLPPLNTEEDPAVVVVGNLKVVFPPNKLYPAAVFPKRLPPAYAWLENKNEPPVVLVSFFSSLPSASVTFDENRLPAIYNFPVEEVLSSFD
jgi:hypothetical protein